MILPIKEFIQSLACVCIGWIICYASYRTKIKELEQREQRLNLIEEPIGTDDAVLRKLQSLQLANKKLIERVERIEKALPNFNAFALVREEQRNIRTAITDIFDFMIDKNNGEQNETARKPRASTRRNSTAMG